MVICWIFGEDRTSLDHSLFETTAIEVNEMNHWIAGKACREQARGRLCTMEGEAFQVHEVVLKLGNLQGNQ